MKDFFTEEDLGLVDDSKVMSWLEDNTILSPNNTLFLKKNVREGILPIILKEILLTRIMIKNSMKKVCIIHNFYFYFYFITFTFLVS